MISQPRAGSTLFQRILGSHPDIHTVSEPWLMLHPLYAITDDNGYHADHNANMARQATKDFLSNLSWGEEEYIRGVRHMYGTLYTKALDSSGKRYFLDKTPRYYLIISELYRTFPQAHFIIVMRNPLAVLCSIINTWVTGRWHRLRQYRADLIRAPLLLLHGVEMLGKQGLTVSYDRLLKHPESEVRKICEQLAIEFLPSMIQYGQANSSRWSLGDQEQVYQRTRPDPDRANNWLYALNDPQIWRLASDYLEFLGEDNLLRMGYTYEELRAILETRRPNRVRLWLASPMAQRYLRIRNK